MAKSNAERVLGEIVNERDHQDRKWGEQNHSDFVWLAILTEEIGEVAKAILEAKKTTATNIDHEIIQVAAVAAAWRECRLRRIDEVLQKILEQNCECAEHSKAPSTCTACGADFELIAITQSSARGLCPECWTKGMKARKEKQGR